MGVLAGVRAVGLASPRQQSRSFRLPTGGAATHTCPLLPLPYPQAREYLDPIRECYEAFVIYSFFAYLMAFLQVGDGGGGGRGKGGGGRLQGDQVWALGWRGIRVVPKLQAPNGIFITGLALNSTRNFAPRGRA